MNYIILFITLAVGAIIGFVAGYFIGKRNKTETFVNACAQPFRRKSWTTGVGSIRTLASLRTFFFPPSLFSFGRAGKKSSRFGE
ncbi:MAG: hypothetical protein Q7S37_01040 [bacterium]|nr:hypothetical protein [bacterium]